MTATGLIALTYGLALYLAIKHDQVQRRRILTEYAQGHTATGRTAPTRTRNPPSRGAVDRTEPYTRARARGRTVTLTAQLRRSHVAEPPGALDVVRAELLTYGRGST